MHFVVIYPNMPLSLLKTRAPASCGGPVDQTISLKYLRHLQDQLLIRQDEISCMLLSRYCIHLNKTDISHLIF